MARLYQTGFELNSATSAVEWTTSVGGVNLSTTTVRSGTYSLRCNPTASTRYMQHAFQADTINTTFHRFYMNAAAFPGATIALWQYIDSGGTVAFSLKITSGGVIQMVNDISSATVLSSSSALSTGTWYRIEVKIVDHATTSAQMELKIDGTTVASLTGLSGLAGGGRFRLGAVTGTSSPDFFFDDVAVNDSTGSYQNSYPGDGKIIHLRPNAAGDNAAWTAYAGTGANYERVDEVTPDDATSAVQSRTTGQIDDYNVDASGIGSGDTVNVVAIGHRVNRSTGVTSSTYNIRAKKTASGTVSESATLTASTTTWRTNDPASGNASPFALVTYLDPDSAAWTQSTLDSMQIGMKIVSGSGDRYVNVSAIWASVDYTPSTGPTINVSDTVTTSESASALVGGAGVTLSITLPVHLLDETGADLLDENGDPLYEEGTGDFVNVSESVSVSVLASTAPLSVNVSDTVSTTEVSSVFAPAVGVISVNQFDSITTAESVAVAIQATTTPTVSVSDTVTTTESSSVVEKTEVNLYDQISYTEAIGIVIASAGSLSISVSDTVSTSESKAIQPVTAVVVSDSTTLSESVALGVPNPIINVSDTVTTSESLDFLIPKLYIGVSDTVTATESSTVSAPPVGSTTIVTSEIVTPTESVEMLIGNLTLNVSDSVTVTENRVVDNSRQVQVSDTATVTESNNFYIPTFYINVSELILSSERVIAQKASGAGGLDTLTIELEASTTHFVIDAERPSITINATSTNIDLSGGTNSVILEA